MWWFVNLGARPSVRQTEITEYKLGEYWLNVDAIFLYVIYENIDLNIELTELNIKQTTCRQSTTMDQRHIGM